MARRQTTSLDDFAGMASTHLPTGVATRLQQVTIDDPEEASQVFGTHHPNGLTPIVITPKRSAKTNIVTLGLGLIMAFVGLFMNQIPWVKTYIADPIIWSGFGAVTYWPIMVIFLVIGLYPLFVLRIPSGVHALMTKHGKYIGIVRAGRHILPPWYRVAYMVTQQSTGYNAPVKDCPTSDNVMVKVDLVLVFHVSDPEKFVYMLGAEKFGALLASAAEEAIRGLVRAVSHHQAYELRGKGANEMIASLNAQFQTYGVAFTTATVTNVVLPNELASALENQTVIEAKKKEQEKTQEYKLRVLQDQEALNRAELNKQNERMAADEEAKREREKIMKETVEIEALKEKRVAEILAQQEASVAELKAEGKLKAARLEAEMLTVTATAESEAAEKLTAQRAYELESERLRVLGGIASNRNIVISGDNGDNLIAQIVGAAKGMKLFGGGDAFGIKDASRSSMKGKATERPDRVQ